MSTRGSHPRTEAPHPLAEPTFLAAHADQTARRTVAARCGRVGVVTATVTRAYRARDTPSCLHGGLRQPGLAVQVRASSVMLSPAARRQEYSRSSLWPLVELCGAFVRLSAMRYFAKLGIMDGAAVRLTHRIVPRASRRNGGKRHVIAGRAEVGGDFT